MKVAYNPDENYVSSKCRKCYNVFKHTQSRHTHEKSCGGIVRTEIDSEFEKCRTISLDKEKETLKLKIKLQGNKIDTKTFRAVNKALRDRRTNNYYSCFTTTSLYRHEDFTTQSYGKIGSSELSYDNR